ncbi:hypothetical protein [Oceanobacillus sojae]|uniref:Uncharacterized protein n=1 Tax=Oceanobacillus sojae TaxID=582851 RepID=A0A511ZHQ1_9BACI|nr:hypothetical protein [Oceanobacillus sojae]GEN86967.1 hypothetical protein OSO01_17060 [Oceanobacillus sojae]
MSISVKKKDQDIWYPSNEMLEMAYHYVVFISFDSDVYTPNRISDDWEEVRQRLVIKI